MRRHLKRLTLICAAIGLSLLYLASAGPAVAGDAAGDAATHAVVWTEHVSLDGNGQSRGIGDRVDASIGLDPSAEMSASATYDAELVLPPQLLVLSDGDSAAVTGRAKGTQTLWVAGNPRHPAPATNWRDHVVTGWRAVIVLTITTPTATDAEDADTRRILLPVRIEAAAVGGRV